MDYQSCSHDQSYMWFRITMPFTYVIVFFMFWCSDNFVTILTIFDSNENLRPYAITAMDKHDKKLTYSCENI